MAKKDLVIAASISGVDSTKQDIEKVKHAVEAMGPAGQKAAQGLTDSLRNIEKGSDRLTKKITDGKTVTTRDFATMAQQGAVLESQIKAAFGNIANAPEAFQHAVKKSEQQIEHARLKVRELTDAVQDQKGSLGEGGQAWSGLGNAINVAAGPMGAMQAKFGLVTAAFSEGWQIGMKLNHLFGTDMSLWEEALGRLGQKANLIVRNASDLFMAEWNLIMGFVHRSPDEIKKASIEIKNGIAKQVTDLGAVLTKTGADWDAYATKVGLHTKMSEDARNKALALMEAKQKLRDEINKVVLSMKNETTEMEKQKGLAETADLAARDRTGYLGGYKRVVDDTTAALEKQRGEVEKLTAAHGKEDPMTRGAIERMEQLERELKSATTRYSETTAEVERYKDQQKAAESSVKQHHDRIVEIGKEQGKLTIEMGKVGGAATQQGTQLQGAATATQAAVTASVAATTATQNHAAAVHLSTQKVISFVDEQGKFHIAQEAANKSVAAGATATTAHGDALVKITRAGGEVVDATNKLRGAFEGMVEPAKSAATSIAAIGTSADMQAANDHARMFIKVLKEMEDQAVKTAAAVRLAATAGLDQAAEGASK